MCRGRYLSMSVSVDVCICMRTSATRGRQRMRRLGGITDSMDVSWSKLRQTVKDREAWRAAVRRSQSAGRDLAAEQQQHTSAHASQCMRVPGHLANFPMAGQGPPSLKSKCGKDFFALRGDSRFQPLPQRPLLWRQMWREGCFFFFSFLRAAESGSLSVI